MTRKIDYSARYPVAPSVLYRAMSTREYWDARVEEMRKWSDNRLVDFTASDAGISVELEQVLPRTELPEIAQTIIKKDMVISRKETYSPLVDDAATGEYTASMPSAPGSLNGTMALFATETGCTMRTTSIAKVFIPFVGGRLEQIMLVNLTELLRNEAGMTQQWLAAH